MSNAIDQRIVEMSFENQKFEKGILDSKKSLSEFSDALKKSTKTDNFSGLEKSVGSMTGSFSAFQQVAIGALRQIGTQAVQTGAQMLNSLTLAPISQGFNEMELKMNSTQTIMASTGESLAKVNQYLEDLNEYSDKTIYSFSDMTQNIGKFTNAGVKLENAVASIKGISNAAALAGANSAEASRAMYNFAQALSAGYVKLIDWKSIENANMATVEFKEQLLESAVAAGTVEKAINGMYTVLSTDAAGKTMKQTISATRNFNESLSHQWLTTEALNVTLGKYSDETTEIGKKAAEAATQVTTFTKLMDTLKEAVGSGWARTFEVIFGDFNEGRELWTGVNDAVSAMIGATSDARNDFLGGALSSGWKLFMNEGISDAKDFENTLAIVAGEASVDIDNLVKAAGSMEKAVQDNWITGEMLTETVSRMSAKIENLSDVELDNLGYTKRNKEELLKLRDALKSGTISAEDFAKKMRNLSGRENIINGLKNSVVALLTILKPVAQAFDQIFPPTTANKFFSMTETFLAFTKQLIIGEETADKIKRTFAGFFAVVDIGWQVVKLLGSAAFELVKAFLPLGDGVLGATASFGDFLVMLNQLIKSSGFFEYGLLGIKVAIAIVKDILSSLVKGIVDFATGLWNADDPLEYLAAAGQRAFGGLLNILKMVTNWLSSKFGNAINMAGKLVNSEMGQGATNVFTTILEVLKDIVGFLGNGAVAAFEYLSSAIKELDFGKIAAFVTGGILLLFIKQLSDLTGAMAGFTNSVSGMINKIAKKFFTPKSGNTIHDVAIAIGVLAASIWLLSTIPADDLNRGLVGLAAAVGIFVAAYAGIATVNIIASKVMKNQQMVTSAFGLVGIAAALAIMAVAITTISKIDKSRVMGAVGVLGLMFGFIVAYQALSAVISTIPGQSKVTSNLAGMSMGLLSLVTTIVILSMIPQASLQNGLGKMATIILVLSGIQFLFSVAAKIGGSNKAITSILGMAAGILALIGVLQILGMIDAGLINRGLPNLIKLTLIIAGINTVMGVAGRIGGGKKAKTNLLAVSLTMTAMIAMIALISMISQEDINKGVITLAAMGAIVSGISILTATASMIAGGNKVQKTLGSVTITMLAFTGIIALLAKSEQSDINKGLLTITAMVGIIAAIELVSALAGKISATGKTFAPMMAAITGLLALTAVLMLLTLVDQKALRDSSVSITIASVAILTISVAMLTITKAVKSMSNDSRSLVSNIAAIIPGMLVLGTILLGTLGFFKALELVLPLIKDLDLKTFDMFLTGIGLMSVLMLTFSIIPFNKANSLDGLIPAFAAMAAVLLGTLAFFGALKIVTMFANDISWSSLGQFSAGLVLVSGLLLIFANMATPLGLAAAIGPWMIGGVALSLTALVLVIAAFTGIAAAMSKLDFDKLSKGIDSLTLVGGGIGRFVGALIGGFAIEALSGIGEGLVGFASALGQFKPEDLNGIKSLAEAFLIITATALIDGISRFVNFGKSPIEVFADQLKKMIEAFNEVSETDVTTASGVLAAMGPMAGHLEAFANAAKSIPNSGGFIGDFMGDNDIDKFGVMLAGFVGAFALITITSATNAAVILAAMGPMAEHLKTFANAAKSIPNSGGFVEEFMGGNDIDKFGVMLTGFVGAFSTITVATVTNSSNVLAAMEPMVKHLKAFANVAQGIPNSGGFIGAFMGENDIDKFGAQLSGMVDVFGIIDGAKLITATNILTKMSEEMLPALLKFGDFSNSLKNSGGFAQIFSGNTTLSEFATEFVRFVNILAGANYTIVPPAMAALQKVTDAFSDVGTEALTNAKKSFTNNSAPLQSAISEVLNDPIKNIKNKKTEYQNAFTDVFKSVTGKSKEYSRNFETLGQNIVDGLKRGINSRKESAVNAVTTVMNSVVRSAKKAVDAHSPSRIFETIGGWCTQGLANGMTKETKTAVTAATGIANATENAIRNALGVHSESTKYANIGNWIPKSIGSGIQSGKNWLLDKATAMGITTGKATASGVTNALVGSDGIVTTGINSLLDALTGKKPKATAAGTAIGAAVGTAAGAAGTTTGTAAGKAIGSGITQGAQSALSNSSTGLGGTGTQTVVKTEIEKLKAILEDKNFYGQITIRAELEEYERLRLKFVEGSEERKEIDKEVYTRLKTIYDAEKEYIDDVTEAQREAAEERTKIAEDYNAGVEKARSDADKKLEDLQKKYDEDVISAKDAANKKLIDVDKTYYEGLAKVLDSAEANRKRAREQYAKDQISINDKLLADIDAKNKAYESAVKSRADAISGSYGLFSKVEEDEDVVGTDLLENLRDQGAALSDWKQQLEALKERGVGDALIEELQQMGPASKAQIKALLTLTDEQLDEYVGLFKGKYTFARVEAEKELVGLKDDTSQGIKDLVAQADKDLVGLENTYKQTMADIDSEMAIDMGKLKETHSESLAEINADLSNKLHELKTIWSDTTSDINSNLQEKLFELETNYSKSMDKVTTDIEKNLAEMKSKYSTTMKDIVGLTEKELRALISENKTKLAELNTTSTAGLNAVKKEFDSSGREIVKNFDTNMATLNANTTRKLQLTVGSVSTIFGAAYPTFYTSGENVGIGLADGMNSKIYLVQNAAANLASAAARSTQGYLQEASPSKLFHGFGQFVSQGFANGILDYADKATTASMVLANGTVGAVSNAMAQLTDDMSDDADWQPVITPVLDLSKLNSSRLADMLHFSDGLGSVSGRMAIESIQNGSNSQAAPTSIINQITMPGMVVRSEADIDLIATKLQQRQDTAMRGRGIRTIRK